MLFKRKKSLKKRYDEKFLLEMEKLKKQWQNEKRIWDNSIESNKDLSIQVKLAEIKYIYMFKEAKARNIKIDKK